MTKRAVAVVVLVVLLFGAAVAGFTAYVVGGGSSQKTVGRCVYMDTAPSDASPGELAQQGDGDRQAAQATRDQKPDECPLSAHWETVPR